MEMFIPTRLLIGKGIVRENRHLFPEFGKKALIVTGKSSAQKSGALSDVTEALSSQGIAFRIFDEVENNPSVKTCYNGGRIAKEFGAEFIIAIGGGSPMDAAKAIATFATNEIEPLDIFGAEVKKEPLPLLSAPLTAGTGSEVTPYSVLTVPEIENKKSFTHRSCFSKIAFLDPDYLASLPRPVLLDTTADALSHAIESMLTRRTSMVSKVYAEAALNRLGEAIPGVIAGDPDFEALLLASSLAGMAISHTGTIIVHSMGYLLTYYKDVPHGRANALLLPGFLEGCQKHIPDRLAPVLSAYGASSLGALLADIKQLTAEFTKLTEEEVQTFAHKAIGAKNVPQNLWPLEEADEARIFATLL